jgi:F0F1-type ATP synthase membrane subunit b/b'
MLAVDATLLIVFSIVWILLFALKRVFFKPLREIMTRRDETIASDIRAGEEAKNKYESNIDKIEESLKAARLAAKETQERFTADALREKEQMLTEIGQECRVKVKEAKEQLEQKVDELKADLAKESKVLSEKIEKRLIDR